MTPQRERDNDEPLRYVHIGYPKAGSTALQRGFFAWHNQLRHLGCGTVRDKGYWDDHGYIDAAVNVALEIDLRYRTTYAYREAETQTAFQGHFDAAKADRTVHAVGISNENLCFNWHGGIDTPAKANRLYRIFGQGTKVIVVLRKQDTLIESLYKENIRFGYPGSFEEYLAYLWQYQDRNLFYDFCFEKVIETYRSLFGEQHVHILLFEEFRERKENVLRELCAALEVDWHPTSIDVEFNKQLTPAALQAKLLMNRRFPHTFQKGVFDPADTHRFVAYYTDVLGEHVDLEHYLDYQARNRLCEAAERVAQKTSVPDLETKWVGPHAEKILSRYREGNRLLAEMLADPRLQEYGYDALEIETASTV